MATDPTRSASKRDRFARKFRRRWRDVRGEVRRALKRDRFRPQSDRSDARQVGDFRDWFEDLVYTTVLEPAATRDVERGRHWTAEHVDELYTHALKRADQELRKVGVDVPTGQDYRQLAKSEPYADELREERLEVYQDVEDAVRAAEEEATREYRSGVREGAAVAGLVAAVNDRVDKTGRNRTDLISEARGVELIADGGLSRYEQAGIDELGVEVEEPAITIDDEPLNSWTTAGDSNVCEQCQALEGNAYKISEIRSGEAPKPVRDTHPRCRCWLIPTEETI
ncbi:hypothetical protein [Haloterrigena salifodinae]|uniref:hypothetical protein n=1 Tax=Haloterrigena salifodinae TaxID=2675099 RepID=UPI000F89C059|nr:hypothetical protein [Haloterrigena salifodinae]